MLLDLEIQVQPPLSKVLLSRKDGGGRTIKDGEEAIYQCALEAVPVGLTQFKWLLRFAGQFIWENAENVCSSFQIYCKTERFSSIGSNPVFHNNFHFLFIEEFYFRYSSKTLPTRNKLSR